jgi:CheY-like chemotaxis protein
VCSERLARDRIIMLCNHSVLLVDDHADIRDILNFVLADEGYNVLTAKNGVEALEMVEDDTFAVILIDVQMPLMDGVEFVRRYRALPGHKAQLIIMTAGQNAKMYAELVGADAYLAKPFELDDVPEIVGKLAGRASTDRC